MTDIPGNTTTKAVLEGSVATYGTFSGELETPGDHDWIRVDLTVGVTYEFYACFLITGFAVIGDSVIVLRNAAGTPVAFADDGGVVRNSFLSFPITVTGTGTYFIDIGEFGTDVTGSYSLFVSTPLGTTNKFLNDFNDVYVGLANERIIGGAGADTILIGSGADALGEQGNDIITGNADQNAISGGLGDDTLDGAGSADIIFGDAGNDVISGGSGVDTLRGGAGNDIVGGDSEVDFLYGGTGKDFLTGGVAGDLFIFTSLIDSKKGAGRDVILDFGPSIDTIDLRPIDAKSGHGDQAFKFIGAHKFHHAAGELRFVKIDSTGFALDKTIIQGDVNGDGKADFEIQLSGLHVLHATDFLL